MRPSYGPIYARVLANVCTVVVTCTADVEDVDYIFDSYVCLVHQSRFM